MAFPPWTSSTPSRREHSLWKAGPRSNTVEEAFYGAPNEALTCGGDGGRGRYRTADRWCVKPELYH